MNEEEPKTRKSAVYNVNEVILNDSESWKDGAIRQSIRDIIEELEDVTISGWSSYLDDEMSKKKKKKKKSRWQRKDK